MAQFSPHSPPTAPVSPTPQDPDALLELVGHLGAALIQSDKIVDPAVRDHVQSAHRLALDLYSTSSGSTRFSAVTETNAY